MGLKLEKITRLVGGEIYLKDIDLELSSGSRNVLLGRTLAGKCGDDLFFCPGRYPIDDTLRVENGLLDDVILLIFARSQSLIDSDPFLDYFMTDYY